MSSILSRRTEKTIIGVRIQILTQDKDVQEKDCSPTLKELREKGSKVKTFAEVFERKPWSVKTGECNWWLKTASPRASTPIKFNFPKSPPVFNGSAKLMELLEKEQEYLLDLNEFIQEINDIVKNGRGYVAMKLREHRNNLMGELRTIYGLHFLMILPEMSASTKCVEFLKFLIKAIEDGHFYCYVAHKMLESMMTKLQNEYIFVAHQTYHDIVDPFTILTSYKNWVADLSNELVQNSENADELEVCIEAEKKLNALMNLIKDAEQVTLIKEVHDVPYEIQVKIMDLVKKHEETCMPMMFLIPKKLYGGYTRYPVSL